MTIILPKKKKQMLNYLKKYIAENGYAPTLSEIAKKFKLSSVATVHEHLEFLEKEGFIKRDKKDRKKIEIMPHDNLDTLGMNYDDAYLAASAIELPVVGLITAGLPIEAIEDRDMTLSVPHELIKKKNSFILKVKGDSMIESLIADGDYVVCEKTDLARDGDIVVALLEDGTATLKKFFKHKNFIRLQPANKKYQPMKVKSLIIQGKVTGIIRNYDK